MKRHEGLSGIAALMERYDFFHPGFSVDCVVLGFHDGVLKILLTKYKGFHEWMLPGSFVFKEEDIDMAASRILKERTGLDNVFLRQFHAFGNFSRKREIINEAISVFKEVYHIDIPQNHWFSERFISLGYYSLIDSSKVQLSTGRDGEAIQWMELNSEIPYFGDHKNIVDKAIETIRLQLNILPVGLELLPDKFTMPDLRILYETLLGRILDRRNFQRKALSLGYIDKLDELRKGGAHKAPILYQFNPEKYDQAGKFGLKTQW